MVDESKSKKHLFYMIVLILTLVVMIVGIAFAIYTFVASQKEDSTVIYSGTLQINYIDGVYIKDPTLYPIRNVNINTYDNVYRNSFKVTSTGTLDQTIDINMIIKQNEFVHNELKYAIFSSTGKSLATGYINSVGSINLANNVFLAHNSEALYTLIIWWADGDYKVKTPGGSAVSGRIDVSAKQVRY